jgi:hypothetical protein
LLVLTTAAATLVAIAVFAALPRSDKQAVRETLAGFEHAIATRDYQTLCTQIAASSVPQTRSMRHCKARLRKALKHIHNPTIDVLSVSVHGRHARAHVRESATGQASEELTYTLVNKAGAWHIQSAHSTPRR